MALPLRDSAGLSPASPIMHLASGQEVHPLWLIYLILILVDYQGGVNKMIFNIASLICAKHQVKT
jgi:hypothetical protein